MRAKPLTYRRPATAMLACGIALGCLGLLAAGCSDMGAPITGTPPPAAPASYAQDIQPIWNSSCAIAGCHAPPNIQAGLDLTPANSYQELLTTYQPLYVMYYVTAGDPLQSVIYYKLEHVFGYELWMPLSPYPQLSRNQRDTIYRWITEGAENN